MHKIITLLLVYIQYQSEVIKFLCVLVFGKNFKPKPDNPTDKKYLKLSVDPLPIFGKPKIEQIYQYTSLLEDYKAKHGKELKPIRRRVQSKNITDSTFCPYCGAPHQYIYDNTGGRGQLLCKVCESTFFPFKPSKDTDPYCPFCNSKLELIKKRKSFDIYRCYNIECPYRTKNLRAMTTEQKALYKQYPHKFKLRFIYRKFHFDFTPLSKDNPSLPKVDLSAIKSSPHVLGLVLTYHINYGLPLRKTAALMFDVHSVKISHQTIANYARAVAPIVKPFVDGFNYELSNSFCGDETYIKVLGKWHYIFFFFDSVKKVILSYRVQKHRDYQSAILAINDVLVKLKEIPEKLNLITDGNPIYLLAQQFFAQHSINFDVTQVIGLTNDDPISKEFRPLKQIIERLNRTFKGNYKPTTGYGSTTGSIANVTLFVAYFNFLRPHSKLDGNVPVVIPELNKLPNMPAKWIKLISMSEDYIKAHSS